MVLMMILIVMWLQNGSAVSELRVGLEIFAIVAPCKIFIIQKKFKKER